MRFLTLHLHSFFLGIGGKAREGPVRAEDGGLTEAWLLRLQRDVRMDGCAAAELLGQRPMHLYS